MSPILPFQLSSLDAKDWLRGIPAGSVDLVVTDPPYSSKEKHRRRGAKSRFGGGSRTKRPWFAVVPDEYFIELLRLLYGVLKNNRHCYVFCDFDTLAWLVECSVAAGFDVHKPLVWDKLHFGMGYHYRAQYEFILFMSKGKRRLNDRGVADVLPVRKVYLGGPAEKPFALMDTLVRQSTAPGELVIDPFTGTGVVGEAAMNRRCYFFGNDVDPKVVSGAHARLNAYLAQVTQ